MVNIRLVAAAAACAVAVSVTGCSTGPGAPQPGTTTSSPVKAVDIAIQMKEAQQKAKNTFQGTFSMTQAGQTVEGTMQVDGSNPDRVRISMTIGKDAAKMDIIVDGEDNYVRMPGLTGPKWVHSVGGNSAGIDPQTVVTTVLNPDDFAEVIFTGTETINGESMRRYRLIQKATSDETPGSYELWLDKDGLPRQIKAKAEGADVTTTMNKWGQPVDIRIPAAGDIVDG